MPRPLRSSFFLPLLLPLALTAPLLAGCGDEDEPAAQPPPTPPANVFLTDDNNYTSVAALRIPSVETVPQADLEIHWDNIVRDLQCHPVNGDSEETDIDNVSFLRFDDMTEDEVAQKLTQGELPQSEVDEYTDFQPDSDTTSTDLSNLKLLDPITLSEIIEDPERSYLMLFSEGTVPGVGARTMIFIRPTDGSSNERVDAPEGCGLLDFEVDLASQDAAQIPADGPFVVDWSGVTVDAIGNTFAYASVDSLLLGFYEDMTIEEIETRIFDLEIMATSLYELPLKGVRKADLTKAVERTTGDNFAGFDRTNGTWMMALLCSSCQNPQPLLLTVFEPN